MLVDPISFFFGHLGSPACTPSLKRPSAFGDMNMDKWKICMWVLNQKRGWAPKMDGENNGKPYEQMDDLGVPLCLETPMYISYF